MNSCRPDQVVDDRPNSCSPFPAVLEGIARIALRALAIAIESPAVVQEIHEQESSVDRNHIADI